MRQYIKMKTEFKKCFLILSIVLFLSIPIISAADFDNTPIYSNNDMTIQIKNWFGILSLFGIDDTIGTATLTSHKTADEIKIVSTGNNVEVMTYDLNFADIYANGLGKVYFYDALTGKEIEKDYYFATIKIEDNEVNDYTTECSKKLENGSLSDCKQVLTGTHKEPKKVYTKISNNDIPKDDVTIALMTDVNKGDYIDGVWTIAGVKISKHAYWRAADLYSYWRFNEGAGTSATSQNGTILPNYSITVEATWDTGKYNSSLLFDATPTTNYGLFAPSNLTNNGVNNGYSISFWTKRTGTIGTDSNLLFTTSDCATDNNGEIAIKEITGSNSLNFGVYDASWKTRQIILSDTDFQFYVLAVNTSSVCIYGNATLVGGACQELTNFNISYSSRIFMAGCSNGNFKAYNILVDELKFYSTMINSSDVAYEFTAGEENESNPANPTTIITALDSPANSYNTSSTNPVYFSGNATITNGNLTNMSLYIWYSNGTIYAVNTTKITGVFNSSNLSFSNFPSNSYKWNYLSSGGNATTNVTAYASLNRTFTIDFTPPVINITYPVNGTSYKDDYTISNTKQIFLNFTVYDSSIQSCGYWNGTGNTTITCGQNTTINITYGNYKFRFFANDTYGNYAETSSNFTYGYYVLENNKVYTPIITSGSVDNIELNITYSSLFSGINVILNYNNTNYTMSTIDTGITREYNYNLLVPSIFSQVNKTFNFIVLLSNLTGITQIQSPQSNQTINPFSIDNCSVNTVKLFELTMEDEENLNEINGTIQLVIDFHTLGTDNLIATYNNSFDYSAGTPSLVCIGNITNYTLSYIIRQEVNESYYIRYRNIQNMTLSSSSVVDQNITLYNLLKTSGYTFATTIVGNIQTSNGNKGLLLDVQKEYITQNKFLSVESSVTDNDGIALIHLIEINGVYNFVISYNGRILGTFNNYRVKCGNVLTGQCNIILNLASASGETTNFETYGGITNIISNDNTTVYNQFETADGQSHEVRSVVLKADAYSNETICDSNITGTSGTLTCNFPLIYQNTNFFVQTFSDGNLLGTKTIWQGEDANWYGVDIFILLLMLSSIVLLMVAHPITIVIGAVIGLVMPILLLEIIGFSFGAIFGAVIYYIILGVLILIVMKNKI